MANTFKFGNGNWAVKKDSVLAYNDENNNFKPLPFDFTRDTIGTYVDSDGLIKTASNNEARIDYLDNANGHLLLEPARTQLIQYSEDFSQSSWTKQKTTVQSNQIISPDGTQNADALFEQTGTTYHFTFETITSSADTEYNFSIFVKKLNRRYVGIQGFFSSTRGNIAFFDLDNGTLEYTFSEGTGYSISDAKIEEYPNDWYRLSANFTAPDTTVFMGLCLADERWTSGTAHDNLYAGDTTKGVYLWGAQLEQGSYPTSYIPTNGETNGVTRAADVCEGAGNSEIFNDSEGVLYAEIAGFEGDAVSRPISVNDGGTSDRVQIFLPSNQTQAYGRITSNSDTTADMVITLTQTDYNKIALKYKENDFAIWANGSELGTDTDGAVPSGLNNLSFDNGSTTDFYGKIKDLKVYNTALTDAELETLTT